MNRKHSTPRNPAVLLTRWELQLAYLVLHEKAKTHYVALRMNIPEDRIPQALATITWKLKFPEAQAQCKTYEQTGHFSPKTKKPICTTIPLKERIPRRTGLTRRQNSTERQLLEELRQIERIQKDLAAN